jgi:hypothetical protein
MTEELVFYAISLARPVFCEIQLLRLIARVKKEATTRQDVEKIYKEMRKPLKK